MTPAQVTADVAAEDAQAAYTDAVAELAYAYAARAARDAAYNDARAVADAARAARDAAYEAARALRVAR